MLRVKSLWVYRASALPTGNQLYHSLLCVVLQFLILRLMGRTITAVLTTFCFQMVTSACHSLPPRMHWGGEDQKKHRSQRPSPKTFSAHNC